MVDNRVGGNAVFPCGTYKILYISQEFLRILGIAAVREEDSCAVERQTLGISHVTIHDIVIVIAPEFPVVKSVRLRVVKAANFAVINLDFHLQNVLSDGFPSCF